MSNHHVTLFDSGFERDFSADEMQRICRLFGSTTELQEVIYGIHAQHRVLDMKRGEFYPEILRANLSLKRALVKAYDLDSRPGVGEKQCHPNFGTNGNIDTILTAMKLREVERGVDPSRAGGLLVATPTYFRNYNSADARRLRLVKAPVAQPSWQVDVSALLELLDRQRPTVVFLVTPNNPTGLAIPDDDILRIIDAAPPDTLVVLDRTLVNIRAEVSSATLLARYSHKQLAILHSCSKYWGLSHLRIGFALYSNPQIADEIAPLLPLGMGLEGTLQVTRILLEHGPFRPCDEIVRNVEQSKQILDDYCRRGPVRCTDFVGNYCLLLLPDQGAKRVTDALDAQGIKVMGGHQFTGDGRNDIIRVHTGGKPEFMQRTVDALEKLCP